MPPASTIALTLLTLVLFATSGCATVSLSTERRKCWDLLAREMGRNTGWVRVHAADALLDHGQRAVVAAAFAQEAQVDDGEFRIGVWRVMARAAATETVRRSYFERIRKVALDPSAPDRLQAVESLCRLDAEDPDDQAAIKAWLHSASDATAAFPCWYLVLLSSGVQRGSTESRLASLMNSPDPVARLRAAYAIGRMNHISAATQAQLQQRAGIESPDSAPRVYLVIAVIQHSSEPKVVSRLHHELISFATRGKPAEQLSAATALGKLKDQEDIKTLSSLLQSPEADARIGAANGLLYLLR